MSYHVCPQCGSPGRCYPTCPARTSALFCGHGQDYENPCQCGPDCYCRQHSCRPRVIGETWLTRQLDKAAREVRDWPEWMRREAGLPVEAQEERRGECPTCRATLEALQAAQATIEELRKR